LLGEGRGDFHNVFGNRPTEWPIAKEKRKKERKTIKTFVLWDAPQLI
jgi:hypothetical protein